MVTAVRFLSILGIVIHGVLFIASVGASGMSDSGSEKGSASLFFFMPFVYFAFCLVTSLKEAKGFLLLPVGVLAHLLIVPFYWRAVHDGIGIIALVPLILAPCWFLMCRQRTIK
jgi:hypothetical protein